MKCFHAISLSFRTIYFQQWKNQKLACTYQWDKCVKLTCIYAKFRKARFYLCIPTCMFCVSFMVNVHLSSTLHTQCNMQIKHQILMLELFPIFLRHTTCTGSWVTSRQLLRPNNQSDLANLHCTFRNRKSIITTDRNQPVFLSRFYKISPSWDQFSRDLKFRIVLVEKP